MRPTSRFLDRVPGRRLARRALLGVLFAAPLLAGPALAHEYWLSASRYSAPAGRPVALGAVAGVGFRGELKPWDAGRVVRFVARSARELDLARGGANGEVIWANLTAEAGGTLVAYQSNFASIELGGAEFDAYLRSEGLDEPLAARTRSHVTGPGRERYRRCPKAWLAGSDAARATRPAGLPLEIVPLAAPGDAATLRVRVLWSGHPLEGALLKAWRSPLAADGATRDPESRDSCAVAWQGRTNSRGEAEVPVAAEGEWLLSTVHMVKCHDAEAADWESTWASLTFARAAAAK